MNLLSFLLISPEQYIHKRFGIFYSNELNLMFTDKMPFECLNLALLFNLPAFLLYLL